MFEPVFAAVGDPAPITLTVDDAQYFRTKRMVAGEPQGDYGLEVCVGLPEALQAAKTSAEPGRLDPALAWK